MSTLPEFCPSLVHIDVARNATDDFNLFHDKYRWQEIRQNPFDGPIALGFQTEGFIEHQCRAYRSQNGEQDLVRQLDLKFSHYQLNFVSVIRPNQRVYLDVRPTKTRQSDHGMELKNRIVLKSDEGLVITGTKAESSNVMYGTSIDLTCLPDLRRIKDRTLIADGSYYYKRKYTSNSNAKNYLVSACVEQSEYFDELADKIHFPESYCTALLSCALLEQAKQAGHDFINHPMVYTSHKLSVDRTRVSKIRSDQMLHFLISPAKVDGNTNYLHYPCYILDDKQELLCQGELTLAPLSLLLDKS